MKKIIVFYPYETREKAFSGGVSKVVISNIIAINAMGHKPILILPFKNKGLIEFVTKNFPYCEVYPLKFNTLSLFSDTKGLIRYVKVLLNMFNFIKGWYQLSKTFKTIAPDIIHYHEVVNFPYLGMYKKAKVILHLHSYRFIEYKRLLPYILNKINKNVHLVISPTKSILEGIKEKLKVKSIVLNTPYLDLKTLETDTSQINWEKEVIRFSFVGRICSIKRIHHFLLSLAKLPNNLLQKIEFEIIGGVNTKGDEQYLDELKKIITNKNLSEQVIFRGYINPIEKVLPLIDYGVILSESEAVPMIGIEYMKYNIPIIGYDVPGINDFLFNKVNGFLIPNGNIEDLTNVLKNIISGEFSNLDFKENISNEYKKYTIDSFILSLQKIYNN